MTGKTPAMRALIGEIICPPRTPSTYVVAYPEDENEAKRFGLKPGCSITFTRYVLPDKRKLAPGQIVLLSGLVEHAKGWRAGKAELVEAIATETEKELPNDEAADAVGNDVRV
jgi:hypothetical protein